MPEKTDQRTPDLTALRRHGDEDEPSLSAFIIASVRIDSQANVTFRDPNVNPVCYLSADGVDRRGIGGSIAFEASSLERQSCQW